MSKIKYFPDNNSNLVSRKLVSQFLLATKLTPAELGKLTNNFGSYFGSTRGGKQWITKSDLKEFLTDTLYNNRTTWFINSLLENIFKLGNSTLAVYLDTPKAKNHLICDGLIDLLLDSSVILWDGQMLCLKSQADKALKQIMGTCYVVPIWTGKVHTSLDFVALSTLDEIYLDSEGVKGNGNAPDYEPPSKVTKPTKSRELVVTADSIVAIPMGLTGSILVVFKPTKETVLALKDLRIGDNIDSIELVDMFPSGQQDTHVSNRYTQFVSLTIEPTKPDTLIVQLA